MSFSVTSTPIDGQPKFFATFPFPYMNGRLHLGHGFTCMKVDVAVKFKQLEGVNTLFPFGFHCTGVPIKAACDTLKDEIASGINERTPRRDVPGSETPPYQFHIMMDMNVPISDIPLFTNYQKWFEYFPLKAISDLQQMGLSVDWRRSFITTNCNPYYDYFVKWYFAKLRAKGYLKYGHQAVVWSPKDQQACSDHARSKGEGVHPKKTHLVRFKILDSLTVMFANNTYLLCICNQPERAMQCVEITVSILTALFIYFWVLYCCVCCKNNFK